MAKMNADKNIQRIQTLCDQIKSLNNTIQHLNERIIDKNEVINYLRIIIKNQDDKIKGLQNNGRYQ